MHPLFARFDFANIASANSITGRNFPVDALVHNYGLNLSGGEAGVAMVCATSSNLPHSRPMLLAWRHPASGDLVRHVVQIRSPSKVRWIHAARIVAGMKGECANRPISAIEQQGNMSSKDGDSFPVSPPCKSTIASRIFACRPWPAFNFTALSYFSPKSCFHFLVNQWHGYVSHSVSLYVRGQGRALLTQRFRPIFLPNFAAKSKEYGYA